MKKIAFTLLVAAIIVLMATTGQAQCPGNLIVNGDFESGNVDFVTDYIYMAYPGELPGDHGLHPDRRYSIVSDPTHAQPNGFISSPDHTPGEGEYMLVANAATQLNQRVWSQEVDVTENTDYVFTYWLLNVHYSGKAPPIMQTYINGMLVGEFVQDGTYGIWEQVICFWTSNENETVAEISLIDRRRAYAGDDFAIDDICLYPLCTPVDSLSLDGDPLVVPVGGLVSFWGEFTNGCDPYGSWDFGYSDPTAPEPVTSPVEADNTYNSPEVYEVTLTVTDGQATHSDTVYVAVYDPTGGFVTGGGWIMSPVNPDYQYMVVGGKANFGFVSKYKKGTNIPTGNTEFRFKAGGLNFHSSSYDWLVVTGSNYARFKGWGSINGEGDYRFMLWAGDKEPDTFRIRIWEEDEVSGEEWDVYDNGMDQPIDGGSIIVHTK